MAKAKSNGVQVYKSYRFLTSEKDPIIDRIRTVMDDEKLSDEVVAEQSGVSPGTLRNWFWGSTKRPQFCTLNAVARSMGYDLTIVKRATGRVYQFKK